jgi:hypothetical protein
MYGTERKLEKPFAVIEKVERVTEANHDESVIADSQPNMSFSILDSTVNIENRTKSEASYKTIISVQQLANLFTFRLSITFERL